MTAERIRELLAGAAEALGPWLERAGGWGGRIAADPFLAAAVAVALLLLLWLVVLLVRRGGPRGAAAAGSGRPARSRRAGARAVERLLEELQREERQFVDLVRAISARCSLQRLMEHDDIEAAFGRLSYLQERRRSGPRKRSSLLSITGGAHELREKRAAMLTVVRTCYASEAIYSSLDEPARTLIDRFLDSMEAAPPAR